MEPLSAGALVGSLSCLSAKLMRAVLKVCLQGSSWRVLCISNAMSSRPLSHAVAPFPLRQA